MRSLLAYLLVFAILLPSVSPWGTIAYYQLNKHYIARVLCVNRDKPQLHCDGKCYLAKRLKDQQDKHDKETTERVQNTPALQLFCDTHPQFIFAPAMYDRLIANHFGYRDHHPTPSVGGLLRPPRM